MFQGVPGADIATTGVDSRGQSIALVPISLAAPWDLGHNRESFIADYNDGKMDGFDSRLPWKEHQHPYGYAPARQVQPYLDMATQYVFADRMFETQQSGSFPAHQYIVSGAATALPASSDSVTSNGIDNKNGKPGPVGCDAPGTAYVETLDIHTGAYGPDEFPCFERISLADLLDAKSLSWRYYQHDLGVGNWHAFDAIKEVRYGNDYANVITPSQTILADIASGSLASLSWVIPPSDAYSDHPGSLSAKGPSWVSAVVNAVGESQYWNSTAIFITWDDWGGWYDHVRPPGTQSFGGLGFRVPMLVISPYSRKGLVTHNQYEFGTIIKFVEDNWGLPRLGTTDVRAASMIDDVFDFTQAPRKFVTIDAKYSKAYFLNQKPSGKPTDYE